MTAVIEDTQTETQTEPWAWRLTAEELAATREKIGKINARAAKRGLDGTLGVHAVEVQVTKRDEALGMDVTYTMFDTNILGTPPAYNGFRFIAVLNWDEVGLTTRCVPGFDGLIDRELLREGWCDHCQTSRRRNETFLVEHAVTGERIQVGSSCIKDFLGWSARPVTFFADAGDLSDELDGFGYGAARDFSFDLPTLLAVAWAAVREFGFVRSGDYYDVPTKHVIYSVLHWSNMMGKAREEARQLAERLRPHIEEAAGQAALIRAYILSDEFSGSSEFVVNLKAVIGAERAGSGHYGLIAAAPQTWARAVERDLRRKAATTAVVNEFVGEVGAKLTSLTVRVKSIRYIDNGFGTSTLYTMVDEAGHIFKWFSSAGTLGDEVTTDVLVINGTVKKHEEYQGNKSTALTRCKLVSRTPEAA